MFFTFTRCPSHLAWSDGDANTLVWTTLGAVSATCSACGVVGAKPGVHIFSKRQAADGGTRPSPYCPPPLLQKNTNPPPHPEVRITPPLPVNAMSLPLPPPGTKNPAPPPPCCCPHVERRIMARATDIRGGGGARTCSQVVSIDCELVYLSRIARPFQGQSFLRVCSTPAGRSIQGLCRIPRTAC